MLQEQLKLETQGQHDMLEKLMYVDDIMNKTLSIDQYKEILITNFLVHYIFEDRIFSALDEDLKLKIGTEERVKLGALYKDIEEAGLDVEAIKVTYEELMQEEGRAFEEGTVALGALYVLEGATLGGNVIQKKLKLNENFASLSLSFYYYTVYESNLMPKWISFVDALNQSIPESEHERVIKGAEEMFAWISKVADKVKATK